MAKVGNHGIIIPRDKKLLRRLYWKELRSLPEIGRMFGVTHKSVERVFRELDIPRRKRRSKDAFPDRGCIECGKPCFKIKHASNGAMYGRRCKFHWNKHRNWLAKEESKRPEVKARRKRELKRWYYHGPLNPTGESQWLSKARSQLRTAKRFLGKPKTRAALASQSAASERAQTSRT